MNHIFLALNNEIIALLELILKTLKRLHKLFIRAHNRISIFLIPVDNNLCDSLLCIDDILTTYFARSSQNATALAVRSPPMPHHTSVISPTPQKPSSRPLPENGRFLRIFT